MQRVYTVLEYSSIVRGETVPNSVFDNLENFILSNSELSQFMNISIKKGYGKVITIKNYVGVVCIQNGITIEILPKTSQLDNISHTRKTFLNMLKSTNDIPFKIVQKGYMHTDNISMLDIFISEFLNSLEVLLRNGLKSKYVSITENSKYLCGKLDYTKHIRYNSIRKDRFYITHDVFTLNNPENRLIKSTLILLKKILPYQFKLQKILSLFSSVEPSKDYFNDFKNSNIPQYSDCLKWCKVFLLGNGFTPFAGDNLTYALLFPMEKVFENYVANLVKKSAVGYTVSVQSRGVYLVDMPSKAFALIPDIVLSNAHKTIILDTKWKLLNVHSKNYGISQQDMYQMFAYAKKYHSHHVILIYPLMENTLTSKELSFTIDDITIEIKFIKL